MRSILIAVLLLSLLLTASSAAKGEVQRKVSININSFDDIDYTKVKIYTGNESKMIRVQVDNQFGNGDGDLTDAEVQSFITHMETYPSDPSNAATDPNYNATKHLFFDDQRLLIDSTDFQAVNLTGGTNETAEIWTLQTQHVHVLQVEEVNRHTISISREMWEYTDLQGNENLTTVNEIRFTAPSHWTVDVGNAPGVNIQEVHDDQRTIIGNNYPRGSNVFINIEQPGTDSAQNMEEGNESSVFTLTNISFLAGLALLAIVVIAWFKYFRRESEPGSSEYSELSADELLDKKEKVMKSILRTRNLLKDGKLTSEAAKEKETALKKRFKAIERELREREKRRVKRKARKKKS